MGVGIKANNGSQGRLAGYCRDAFYYPVKIQILTSEAEAVKWLEGKIGSAEKAYSTIFQLFILIIHWT